LRETMSMGGAARGPRCRPPARVGKEIAHLTYGRLVHKTDHDRQWAFTEITRALIDVLNRWLIDAPSYVRHDLRTYIKDYEAQPENRRQP
jgi:hypothetical protein